jgi:hypothetical protein
LETKVFRRLQFKRGMSATGKIQARLVELSKVCPGNALVWEFVQNKGLERTELVARLDIMFARQLECSCEPGYIEKVHKDGYDAVYRRKVIELYLEVSIILFLLQGLDYKVPTMSMHIRPLTKPRTDCLSFALFFEM